MGTQVGGRGLMRRDLMGVDEGLRTPIKPLKPKAKEGLKGTLKVLMRPSDLQVSLP